MQPQQFDKIPFDPLEVLNRVSHDAENNATESHQSLVNYCIERNILPPRVSEHLPISAPVPTIISQKLNDPSNRWREFLLIEKINDYATIPTIGTPGSVGYDLSSIMVGTIAPGKRALISTGIIVCIPPGHYGRIAPRSGLAYKCGIDVLAGVIDTDYRGEVGVVLVNHGESPFSYQVGDKIAQLILERCSVLPTKVVASIKDHSGATKRGTGGFGSTDKGPNKTG